MVKKLMLVIAVVMTLIVSTASVSQAGKGADPGEQMGPCSGGCND